MLSDLLIPSFYITCIIAFLGSAGSFANALATLALLPNISNTLDFPTSALRLPDSNPLPQPPDPFVIYGPGTPPRTRVEFTRYSHRIPAIALSDALIRCLFTAAKRAIRDGGSRPLGDFYRFSSDEIAIVMSNKHEPGHEMTSDILTDVLWTLWQFASEVILLSATFTVEYDGKSVSPFLSIFYIT